MITDKISNLGRYLFVPNVDKVINYLKDKDLTLVENGKYDLGDDCFVKVMEYVTAEEGDETLLEAHREYLDLQLLASGEELFLIQAIELGEEAIPYNKAKDVEFYKSAYTNSLALDNSNFVIVFPNDLHVGNVSCEEDIKVKKFVFKLKI